MRIYSLNTKAVEIYQETAADQNHLNLSAQLIDNSDRLICVTLKRDKHILGFVEAVLPG